MSSDQMFLGAILKSGAVKFMANKLYHLGAVVVNSYISHFHFYLAFDHIYDWFLNAFNFFGINMYLILQKLFKEGQHWQKFNG